MVGPFFNNVMAKVNFDQLMLLLTMVNNGAFIQDEISCQQNARGTSTVQEVV